MAARPLALRAMVVADLNIPSAAEAAFRLLREWRD
jgi:hypothetical protein